MNLLVTICARGGSKGLPGKNIRKLADKPLLAYSIDTALQFQKDFSGNVVLALSTDSNEIKTVAAEYGLVTEYLRPQVMATDKVSKTPALAHVLQYHEEANDCKFDYLIDLDVTSPLRTGKDLSEAIEHIESDPDARNLITVSPPHRNPYFNMVERQANGYFAVSKKPAVPFYSRQDAPKVYDMNSSFYIFRRNYFEEGYEGSLTDKTLIYEIKHACYDVDSLDDFEYLEYLINTGKWTF